MNPNSTQGCLKAKWRELLDKGGHHIHLKTSHRNIIRSRNGFKKKYRWILLTGEDAKHTLTKSEQLHIRHHLKQAEAGLETAYLVVGFIGEPKRIVVLPAGTALNVSSVRSDKGGIAWDD
jgi:hypothetical protein